MIVTKRKELRYIDQFYDAMIKVNLDDLKKIGDKLTECKGIVYLIGNGGSCAIASHAAVDLQPCRAIAISDSALLTRAANDFGWENAPTNPLIYLVTKKDILIAISSSGQSANIINAVHNANRWGAFVITFTGFNSDNPLKQLGNINIWVDSKDYGIVESAHTLLFHMIGK